MPVKVAMMIDDISACATRWLPPKRRNFYTVERQVARARGAVSRSVYERICTYDPCPLVHGNVLMWRNRGHLTVTFAKRLTPSMRSIVRAALR